jgi:transcriptional regulator with XRE-family HTH domain
MKLEEKYGPRIRQLRVARKEPQVELAVVLGLSRPHVTNIENGKDPASIEALIAVAKHYGASLDWIIRGTGSPMGTALSDDEIKLLESYRKLPAPAKDNAIKLFEVAANIAGA